ncbi:uncharacterized protein LOC110683896 [Chenopodium quinoa]|uniref:uncharacterized protein LOC110683896 n=1 Tax=Chenopodium quinoa TaxID=63459 RepID=UPI000B7957BE|nr:uncharacterized protein LOC110683896 [Chenopodium quinoa]
MDFTLKQDDSSVWRLTRIYGFHEEGIKHETWKLLENLGEGNVSPWLCFGDFNCTLMHCEKQGGNPKNQNEIDGFRESMNNCHLRDLHFVGPSFTWSNNRADDENIQERLDRFVATEDWIKLFPCSMVEHLPRRKKKKKRRRGFKFEKEWLRDDEYGNIISEAWNLDPDSNVKQKIEACSARLRSWSSNKSIDFTEEIKCRRERMAALMNLEPTDDNIAEMKEIDKEIDELEGREEAY